MSAFRCTRLSALLAFIIGVLSTAALCGCTLARPIPTPTPTTPAATATPTATAPPSPTPIPSPTPTVPPETDGSTEGVRLASSEGSGTFAIASLSGISLEAGHDYVLQVTSDAGQVSFFGSYSASALGNNGQPGVQVELLDGTTPAVYPITAPVANPIDWIYAVNVQNRGSGGIIITILDVTEGQDPLGDSLLPRERKACWRRPSAWRLSSSPLWRS
jgi:hypothetical protein